MLPDPRNYQPDIPEWMILCIHRFTHKDPTKRPQSANDAYQLWLHGSSENTNALPSDQRSTYPTPPSIQSIEQTGRPEERFQQSISFDEIQNTPPSLSQPNLPSKNPYTSQRNTSSEHRKMETQEMFPDIQFVNILDLKEC